MASRKVAENAKKKGENKGAKYASPTVEYCLTAEVAEYTEENHCLVPYNDIMSFESVNKEYALLCVLGACLCVARRQALCGELLSLRSKQEISLGLIRLFLREDS